MKAQRKKEALKDSPGHDGREEGLRDEVSAFASQLGLSAGSETGFNDADFRPELAKQHIGKNGELVVPVMRELYLQTSFLRTSSMPKHMIA